MVTFKHSPHTPIHSVQQINQDESSVVTELIEFFAGYVQTLAGQFASPILEYNELIHMGNIAIFRAVRSYDAKKGDIYNFVRKSIKNAIFEAGRKTKALKKYKRFVCPSDTDFDSSLSDFGLIDENKDINRVDFEDALPIVRDRISHWRAKLNAQQCRLIELIFYGGMRQAEVATVMGLTRSRIGQIYQEIIYSGRINLTNISEI